MATTSSQLGRTFHGCLTCRKRKVRCNGGDPCPNCLRMRITCHGSFDDNIRMSFGSSAGQKRKSLAAEEQPRKSAPHPDRTAGHSSSNPTPLAPTESCIQTADDENTSSSYTGRNIHDGPSQAPKIATPNPPLPSLTGDYSGLDFFGVSDEWDFDFSFDNFWSHGPVDFDMPGQVPEEAMQAAVENFEDSAVGTSGNHVDAGGMARSLAPPATTEQTLEASQENQPAPRNDDFYFQHYEKSIGSWAYSLKEDGKANYLRFVVNFIRGPHCPEDSPFRLSVLAWTAKHWQMTSDAKDSTWETYHQQALVEIERLKSGSSTLPAVSPSTQRESVVASKAEIIICSTLFLCRCDLLNDNVRSMRSLLESLAEHLAEYLLDCKLSAFACQILLWLAYLHIRISIFSQPKGEKGSADVTLLDVITSHPDYEYILSQSHLFVAEVLGKSYPEETEEQAQDVEKLPVSTRTHETFRLISRMLHFRSWRSTVGQENNTADRQELATAKIDAINIDIKRMEAEFALAMATNASASVLHLETAGGRKEKIHHPDMEVGATGVSIPDAMLRDENNFSPPSNDRAILQWLSCYAVFLSAKLLWSRVRNPEARSDSKNTHTVTLILKIALHMQHVHRKRAVSASSWLKIPRAMMWPLPLFMAGIETTDAIYADWIRKFMDEVSTSSSRAGTEASKAEKQGNGGWISSVSGGTRAQTLMMRVREAQDVLGCRVDIGSVMNEMSGGNGVFVI